jgi:hypothetical protein
MAILHTLGTVLVGQAAKIDRELRDPVSGSA